MDKETNRKDSVDQRLISFAEDLSLQPPPTPRPISSTGSIYAAALSKAFGSLNKTRNAPISRRPSSSSNPSYYPYQHTSPLNSTASIDRIAPTKSFESFATLQSLLKKGDVFTATYSHFSWEREDDLAVHCSTCREGRCATCHGEVFTEVIEFGEKLTFENREVKICTPCKHGFCSGGTLRQVMKGWDDEVVGCEKSERRERRSNGEGMRGSEGAEDW